MKQIIQGMEKIPPEARGGVLTIGNFDGVHIGHQRILLTCRSLAGPRKCPVVVITFDPLPEAILHPQALPPLIYPVAQNAQLLLDAGADLVVVAPATRELLSLTPRQFVEEMVIQHVQPRQVVEGSNFFFGRGRAGDVATLQQLGARLGFDVTVVDPVVLNLPEGERRVSSTLIREMVAEGRIEDANFCLGREFELRGVIVAGEGRGRTLEFPTANLEAANQVVPADGVYAARAHIGDQSYLSALSIGNKPTFGSSPRTVEAFLIDAHADVYGREMTLSIVRRLRDQRKFDGADALRRQIAQDVEEVRKLLA